MNMEFAAKLFLIISLFSACVASHRPGFVEKIKSENCGIADDVTTITSRKNILNLLIPKNRSWTTKPSQVFELSLDLDTFNRQSQILATIDKDENLTDYEINEFHKSCQKEVVDGLKSITESKRELFHIKQNGKSEKVSAIFDRACGDSSHTKGVKNCLYNLCFYTQNKRFSITGLSLDDHCSVSEIESIFMSISLL